MIVETTATNLNEGSMTHYPFYALIADGAAWTPECYRVSAADRMVAPGGSSTSLAGFGLPSEPAGGLTVVVDDSGTNYSIDLTSAAGG